MPLLSTSANHPSRRIVCLMATGVLVAVPSITHAFDLSVGVGVGGILAGAKPRLGVSPHVAMTWSTESGVLFAMHETPSVLPAINEHGPGVYNQLAAVLGYGWKDVNLTIGPALSMYSMPACNATICRHVTGFSVGGHAQVEAYFVGRFGISASLSAEWIGGDSVVLTGSVAATVVAGPVLRWSVK